MSVYSSERKELARRAGWAPKLSVSNGASSVFFFLSTVAKGARPSNGPSFRDTRLSSIRDKVAEGIRFPG